MSTARLTGDGYGTPGSWRRIFFKGSAGCPEILNAEDCGAVGLGKRHAGKVIGGQAGGRGRGTELRSLLEGKEKA